MFSFAENGGIVAAIANIQVTRYSSICLQCSVADGKQPVSGTVWKKDGVQLQEDPGHINGVDNNTLAITRATLEDVGWYTCVSMAALSKGTHTASTVQLDIVGECICSNLRINY